MFIFKFLNYFCNFFNLFSIYHVYLLLFIFFSFICIFVVIVNFSLDFAHLNGLNYLSFFKHVIYIVLKW